MKDINRRRFIAGTSALAGSAAVYAALGGTAYADASRIRHFWWGNPDRDKRTYGAIDIFNNAHPDIEVVGESLGANDYFTKLATQIAGGNMPDVIQQGYGVMFEYVERGAIVALDDYLGDTLDVSKFDQSALQAGTVDGKLYGVSIGANAHMALYNTRLFEEAGVVAGDNFDPYGWTYDDLARIGGEIKKATGVWGTDDNTADYQNFSDFTVQSGHRLFNEDGTLGYDADVVAEYFNIWQSIREANAAPPGPESAGLAGTSELSQLGLVTGQTAISYLWSNQLVGVQSLMKDKIGAAMFPNTPELVPGSYIQPSQLICLTRDSVDPKSATTYMSAFVNDPDMTAVLGLERGVPANSEVRAALEPTLSEPEAITVAFFNGIQGKDAPLPKPAPSGALEVEKAYERLAVQVLLDPSSIGSVAKDYVRNATAILRRA